MCGTTAPNYVSVRKIILLKIVAYIVPVIMPHGMGVPVYAHSETVNGVLRNEHVFVKQIITEQTAITVQANIQNGMRGIINAFVHYKTVLGIKIRTSVNV